MGDSHNGRETVPAASRETFVDVLQRSRFDFELLPHPQTFSAAAEAHALGVLEQEVAKTVVVRDDHGDLIRAVVPASCRLDLDKLARELGAREVELLDEPELRSSYPEFDLGAVPPFSGSADDGVIIDRRLAECDHVVFEAGAHDLSVRLRAEDLLEAAGALVADIACD